MFLLVKRSIGFFIPGGIVFIAALAVMHQAYLDCWLHLITASMPYIVLGFGFLLGLRFHRSRLALAVLVMIVADRTLYYYGPAGTLAGPSQSTVLQMVILLLPINILLLYFAKDRSLLTPSGLFHLALVAAQPVAGYILLTKNPVYLHHLDHRLTSLPHLGKITFPDTIILVYGGVLALFFIYSILRNKAVQKGFFWALLSAGWALHTIQAGENGSFFFSIAGLIIVLSVIETAYRLAYHDALTGLPGRQALNTTLQNLGKRYTIAMLDIDFFKKFNDRYGHDVGDQVLCMVASHINRVGGGGKPFRYGGEEFTIVFSGKTASESRPYLEKVRESVESAQFKVRGKSRPRKAPKRRQKTKNSKMVSVTISIGAAESGSNLTKTQQVLKAADKALYRAKKKGRNCTVT